jgi:hypothetical protein
MEEVLNGLQPEHRYLAAVPGAPAAVLPAFIAIVLSNMSRWSW